MRTKKALLIGGGALVLVLISAGASALVMQNMDRTDKPVTQATRVSSREHIRWNDQPQPQQQAANNCDDGNIVGAIVGGAGGGIAGSQIGDGTGKTAATIGGTLGGAYLGGKYLPTRNVTCR